LSDERRQVACSLITVQFGQLGGAPLSKGK
jgi:hypothetical protein